MKRLVCMFFGHDWHMVRPINAKFYDYWTCYRCDKREDWL